MAAKKPPLSPIEIRRLCEPGLHLVGDIKGLYLQIKSENNRSWILRFMLDAHRRDMGLGGYPEISLAEAKDLAREARSLIRQGLDPIALREAIRNANLAANRKKISFREAATRYIDLQKPGWKNAKHTQQWENSLEQYIHPRLGNMPVDAIDTTLVLSVLEPVWSSKHETATRLRGRLESILSWATVSGFRTGTNPAQWRGHLDKILPSISKKKRVQHFSALDWRQANQFILELRQQQGTAARALEFLILTATRSGEVRGAQWSEFDLENGYWAIPADRMKSSQEHTVVLSAPAIRLLTKLPRYTDNPLVFPSPRGLAMSDMTMTAVLRRMGKEFTVHGFRSTFRDWAAETTNHPNHVVEMALAHTIGSAVEKAYRRGELLEKRQLLMSEWANYLA